MNKILIEVDVDLEDLIPGFMENRAEDISKLDKYISCKDFESIRILGHSMKGFGAGYGFNEISVIGAKLEHAAKLQDIKQITTETKNFKDYIDNIEIKYVEL